VSYYTVLFPASKDKEVYLDLIKVICSGKEFNEELSIKILEQIMERHFATIIVNRLIPVVEGQSYNELLNVYSDAESYIRRLKNPPREFMKLTPCELTLQEVVDTEINYEGLSWHLPSLNEAVGLLKRKSLGLVYAFVDSGKSSFSLAACAKFAKQIKDTEEVILYCGNEESASVLNLRLTQAILGKTRYEIAESVEECENNRKELGFYHVKIFDQITNIKDIVALLEEYHPVCMFIDQAVKVEDSSSDKEIRAIQRTFNAYRELAKLYDTAIVGVAQGKGECENKQWLNLSDIYNSRVAIQGELDYAIGIGRNMDNPAYIDARYINISKNKMGGPKSKFIVGFDDIRCQWKE